MRTVLLSVMFDEDISQDEAERRVQEAFLWAEIPPTWDYLAIIHTAEPVQVMTSKDI